MIEALALFVLLLMVVIIVATVRFKLTELLELKQEVDRDAPPISRSGSRDTLADHPRSSDRICP